MLHLTALSAYTVLVANWLLHDADVVPMRIVSVCILLWFSVTQSLTLTVSLTVTVTHSHCHCHSHCHSHCCFQCQFLESREQFLLRVEEQRAHPLFIILLFNCIITLKVQDTINTHQKILQKDYRSFHIKSIVCARSTVHHRSRYNITQPVSTHPAGSWPRPYWLSLVVKGPWGVALMLQKDYVTMHDSVLLLDLATRTNKISFPAFSLNTTLGGLTLA